MPLTSLISITFYFISAHTNLKKWSDMKVIQSCLTHCNSMDYKVHGILQARILVCVAFSFFRGSSQSRDWTQVSHIAGRFFTCWATKPKYTGVGSLSLLQPIFPTQELNRSLLYCRQTLYQQNFQGSPISKKTKTKTKTKKNHHN